jgi:hypothetical protein
MDRAYSIFDLPPPTIMDRLNYKNDCSLWQVLIRMVRGPFRRLFYPNGPRWFSQRISCVGLIRALYNCDEAEAREYQKHLDGARLETWLKGF